MDGQRRAEVRAEIDGFVASWSSGVDKHEGQSLGMVGTPAGDTGAAVSWQFANGLSLSLSLSLSLCVCVCVCVCVWCVCVCVCVCVRGARGV